MSQIWYKILWVVLDGVKIIYFLSYFINLVNTAHILYIWPNKLTDGYNKKYYPCVLSTRFSLFFPCTRTGQFTKNLAKNGTSYNCIDTLTQIAN